MTRHPNRRDACLGVAAAIVPAFGKAQSTDEEALRSRVAEYLSTWGRRDVASWSQIHAENVRYLDPYMNEKRGRAALAAYFPSFVALYDLDLGIVRIRIEGDRASVVLRSRYSELPLREGKYVRVLNREPVLSRWQRNGGVWEIVEFIDNTARASELIRADGLE